MRAVVFDLNGTLSNDEPLLARIYCDLLADQSRPLTEGEYFEHLAGLPDFSRDKVAAHLAGSGENREGR